MWDRISNFGDAINPHIIAKAGGLPPVKVRSGKHILGVGSVMHRARTGSQVWGTGIMYPHMAVPVETEDQIHAVRGRWTRDQLHARGLLKKDVPLGDPGYLVGQFWPADTSPGATTGRIGVVPHHGSTDAAAFQALAADPDGPCMLIDMRTQSLSVLAQIRQCDVIVSQSLHGLIFAEAYGKPSVWISTQGTDDWRFKFNDWYSTTAHPQLMPVMFDAHASVDFQAIARQAELRTCTIDTEALLASFPLREVAMPMRRPLLDFAACRERACARVPTPLLTESRQRLDDEGRELLRRKVAALFKEAFADWAESQYLVLGDDAYFAEAGAIDRALRFMNRRPKLAYVFLQRLSTVPGARAGLKHDPYADVHFSEGPSANASNLLLRPSGEFNLASEDSGTIYL